MIKQTLNYNIHNLVKFQVIRKRGIDIFNLINLKFSSFQVNHVVNPDIIFNIGSFTPETNDSYLIDHKYYVREDYFFCHDSEGNNRWRFEVSRLNDDVININFSSNQSILTNPLNRLYSGIFFPMSFLLRAIEHKLAQKGCLLSHSAGISKDGKAYLLSGRAGCFKTTLCMDFLRHGGFRWLGDDRVILVKDKIFGFPMNAEMFSYMASHLPTENINLIHKTKFILESLPKTLKTPPDNHIYNESGVLSAILLFNKNNSEQLTMRPITERMDLINILKISNRLEDFKGMGEAGIDSGIFLKYLLAYNFVFPNHQEQDLQLIGDQLSRIPIYEINIPSEYSGEIYRGLIKLLEEIK